MKKSELFPVLVGYASNLPPNTVMDIEVLHRLLVDKLDLNMKTSTLKQYLTLLANAGFSVKKKRVTREKPVYFVVEEGHKWPFKQSLQEVKELSVKRGSATIEVVASRKELGLPLISIYKKTEFDEADSILEVKEEKDLPDWHDIDFEQLKQKDLKEILMSVKVSDESLGKILKGVLASTFIDLTNTIHNFRTLEREAEEMKKCKSNLEEQNSALEGERTNLERQLVDMEQKLVACESSISVLEMAKTDLSDKLLKEQDRSVELEKRIAELQRDKEDLEIKLRGSTVDSEKLATIAEVMQSKGG